MPAAVVDSFPVAFQDGRLHGYRQAETVTSYPQSVLLNAWQRPDTPTTPTPSGDPTLPVHVVRAPPRNHHGFVDCVHNVHLMFFKFSSLFLVSIAYSPLASTCSLASHYLRRIHRLTSIA